MVNKLSVLDWLALILVIVGGLNWGLVGIFSFELVSYIFGVMTSVSQIVYVLIGLSALYLLFVSGKFARK